MTHSYVKTGALHMQANTPCQDAVFFSETPKLLLIALADGVSECENSHIGAVLACKTAAEYVLEYASTLNEFDDQKVAYLILDQVVFALEEKAAELGCSPESLSSTLCFCCVNRQSRNMVAFSLGDGGVFTIQNGQAELLLAPRQTALGGTAGTMTRDAYRAVQIRRCALPAGTQVLLCSDGMLKVLDEPAHSDAVRGAMACGNFEGLKTLLERAHTNDDCSFIVC